MNDKCPVCGKGEEIAHGLADCDGKVAEWTETVSHLDCVLEKEREASVAHGAVDFWQAAEAEQQKRAEQAEDGRTKYGEESRKWRKRAEQAEAEVERLRWMLDTLLHDYLEIIEGEWGLHDGEDEDSHKADLARRYEEAHRD